MPGVFNLSIDEALKEAAECVRLGIGGLLLFGLPAEKDEQGTGAWAEDGIVQQALRAIKRDRMLDGLVTIADVCLCEYTSHGHCGVVARDGDHFEIRNDASVALIAKAAASLAARSALQEGATALVVDVAGPTTYAVEGDLLAGLARGWVLVRTDEGHAWAERVAE